MDKSNNNELQKMKTYKEKVPLSKKIEIFEEFLNTGGEIVGKTVYKGYPIGMWAIQIRRKIKIHKMGLKGGINPSKEELKKLKVLGILEKQRETLDEKMDYLLQWVEKYPDVKIVWEPSAEKKLKGYAESDDEYNKLLLEYEKAKKCYTYICDRKSRGELEEKYFEKCKEAKLNPDIFGYSTHIEELSKKFGLEHRKVDYLLEKYGSIENFVRLYRNGKLKDEDLEFAKRTIKSYIDIDENPYSDNYDRLIEDIYGERQDIIFYSSKRLQEVIERLTERQKFMFKEHYGLETGKMKMFKTIAEEENISKSGASYIAKTVLEKIRKSYRNSREIFVLDKIEDESDFQKEMLEVFKESLDKSNIVFKTVKSSRNDSLKYFYSTKFDSIRKMIKIHNYEEKFYEEENTEKRNLADMTIDQLGLSLRARNCLMRAGFESVDQLASVVSKYVEDGKSVDDFFSKINYCGKRITAEIKLKLEEIGINLENDSGLIDLESIRIKRERLQGELSNLRQREKEAQELLNQYNALLGDNEENKNLNDE